MKIVVVVVQSDISPVVASGAAVYVLNDEKWRRMAISDSPIEPVNGAAEILLSTQKIARAANVNENEWRWSHVDQYLASFGSDLDAEVRREFGCPQCGERKMDFLIIHDDLNSVTCATCGRVYNLDLTPQS